MPIFSANANVSLFHMGVLFKSVPSTSKMAARIFSESLNMKAPFKKADKKPALNADLWEKCLDLLDTHQVELRWVKGHAGHPENERCDALAVIQRDLHMKK